jgi:hypothetical protein
LVLRAGCHFGSQPFSFQPLKVNKVFGLGNVQKLNITACQQLPEFPERLTKVSASVR